MESYFFKKKHKIESIPNPNHPNLSRLPNLPNEIFVAFISSG